MAKYTKEVQSKVKTVMKEFKTGKLKSGTSDKKVTNPKQAIAIAFSEAKQEGLKVPGNPKTKKKAKSE